MNIPTTLTALRIFLVPVLVIVFYLPFTWAPMACAAIFVLAGGAQCQASILQRLLCAMTVLDLLGAQLGH